MKDIDLITNKLEICKSLDDMQILIKEIANYYEVDHLAYHVVTNEHAARHLALVTYPDEWVKHYIDQNLVNIDPVVQTALSGVLPFSWGELKKDTPELKKMFGDARDIGLGNQGLTFQVRDQYSKFAILSLNAEASDQSFIKFTKEYRRDFMMLSYMIHNRVQTLSALTERKVRLSPSELEVVKWAAAGKTTDETAMILGKSTRMVRAFMDSARHKLGADTKAHAVTKALQMRLIDQISIIR
jgi:DNA-binding CsgD family transcriptional regulator